MFNRNLKILILIIVVLLGLLNIYKCEEEIELNLDDENNSDNVKGQNMRTLNRKYADEDDEFDNPILLNENVNKGRNKVNAGRAENEMGGQLPPRGIPIQQDVQGQNTQNEGEKKLYLAYYEIVMILFVLAFIINCILGKNQNQALATKWYTANQKFFEENYAHIGVSTDYNTRAGVPILKESYNNFKFYASGRVFLKWMLVNMDFKKRQDLVSLCTSLFLFNEKDRITYESSITPPTEVPLVFCFCKKKDVKSMRKTYSDIDYFTKSQYPPFMSENLVFLTEDYEIFESMFRDKNFVSLFKKIEPVIDIIYFTDRQSYTKEQHAIFFSFDLSASKTNYNELFADLTLFVHYFIDLLCSSRLSSNYLKQSEKSRAEYTKLKAKELQEKNAEEMRQKKLDKLSNSKSKKGLTVEQAQKLEEKEKKEQLKNQKKKQMKIVKK